jgi:ubiquinone/menaquinone biosynthesis C-methylase UbiE
MKIDVTPDPALYPFESRWLDWSAGRMHYIDEGRGHAVTGFNAFQFAADVITALAEARRVARRGGQVAICNWFEPSTAHRKSLQFPDFRCLAGRRKPIMARIRLPYVR